jgi:hypothetical protein
MSKSTNRYGPVTQVLRSSIEAKPKPSPVLVAEWKFLNSISNFLYGSGYFDLSDKIRLSIHEIIKGVFPDPEPRMKLVKVRLL